MMRWMIFVVIKNTCKNDQPNRAKHVRVDFNHKVRDLACTLLWQPLLLSLKVSNFLLSMIILSTFGVDLIGFPFFSRMHDNPISELLGHVLISLLSPFQSLSIPQPPWFLPFSFLLSLPPFFLVSRLLQGNQRHSNGIDMGDNEWGRVKKWRRCI